MRKLISLIPLITVMLLSLAICAQHGAMYVAIKTGLNIRDKPGVNGKVIDKIPYAAKIILPENSDDTLTIQTENLNGIWRKIKYNNKTGYIVDSYLFPAAPPKPGIKTLKEYMAQVSPIFGNKLVVKLGTMNNIEDGGWEMHKQLYKNGAEWHEFVGYEYNSSQYFLTGFSLQEAFLLLRMIPEFSDVISEKDIFPLEDTTYTKGQNEYQVKVEKEQFNGGYPWIKKITIEFAAGAISTFEMYMSGNQAVISLSSGV